MSVVCVGRVDDLCADARWRDGGFGFSDRISKYGKFLFSRVLTKLDVRYNSNMGEERKNRRYRMPQTSGKALSCLCDFMCASHGVRCVV